MLLAMLYAILSPVSSACIKFITLREKSDVGGEIRGVWKKVLQGKEIFKKRV